MSDATDKVRRLNNEPIRYVPPQRVIDAMVDVIEAIEEMNSPVYDGHEGPYLPGVRADEFQEVIDALARFREVAGE